MNEIHKIPLFRCACRLSLAALAAVLFAALLACGSASTNATGGGGGGKKGKGGKGFDTGPVPVVTAQVTAKNVPIEIQVVGNVEAYSMVSVRPQVSGQLTSVSIKDGDDVKKGDVLFTVDARPLQGQLSQADANLLRSRALQAQAEANLARDEAQERNAKAIADRAQKLYEEKLISREQADQSKTAADVQANALNADRAAIASAKAQIEADLAAINNIKLQLEYTKYPAPIDGRVGNVTNKVGNIVTQNNTELMQILQVAPIYVTFAVPESRLGDVKRYMGQGTLPVTARPQDGSGDPETGSLSFIDSAVDTSTGTIKLKGTFSNEGRKLWPGQFVNVTLRLTTRGGALVVPNQAVQTGQDGTFVYVVGKDRTVEVRPVVTGPRIDLDLVIDKGVSAGETVVTEGQLRLQPGSRVQLRGEGREGGGFKGGEGRKGGEGKGAEGGKGGGEFKGGDGGGKQTGEFKGRGKRGGDSGGEPKGGAERGDFKGGAEFKGGKGRAQSAPSS